MHTNGHGQVTNGPRVIYSSLHVLASTTTSCTYLISFVVYNKINIQSLVYVISEAARSFHIFQKVPGESMSPDSSN